MSDRRTEYRVVWRREGRQRASRIFQRAEGAAKKVQAILGLEKAKVGTGFETMPDLAEQPVIQERTVGPWGESFYQITEVPDVVVDRMREFAEGRSAPPLPGDVPF